MVKGRVTQVIGNITIRFSAYEFLFKFNRNYMRLSSSYTIFEILSLIFQKVKRSRDSDHAPFRDSVSSVGWDLLCSTHSHIPNLNCLGLPAMNI